jgi:L-ribulose-5-phosphate 3-epimerase
MLAAACHGRIDFSLLVEEQMTRRHDRLPTGSRRDLLRFGAATVAPLLIGPRQASAATLASVPGLRLFSKPLQWLDYEPLAEVAAAAGYAGIDLTVRPGGHVEPERVADALPAAVAAARRHGLTIDMMVTAITSADDPGARKLLEVAARAGVKLYRMGYLTYDDGVSMRTSLKRTRERMLRLADLNRACGIVGCYQNHHGLGSESNRLGSSVWDIDAILDGVDPAWIGCQYDPRHAVAEATGSWSRALRLIAPRIRSVCLKDFRWAAADSLMPEDLPAGQGVVPWNRVFTVLRELGVDVPLTVHCEWRLFSDAERSLPEADRRNLAIERIGRDRTFFATSLGRQGYDVRSTP